MQFHTIHRFISQVLHPIFTPLWAVVIFIWITPHYFPKSSKWAVIGIVLFGTVLLPFIALIWLKSAQLITSFELRHPQERKFPLVIFTLLALAMSRLFFRLDFTHSLGMYFFAGSLSALVGYWFLWWHVKVSLHTMGWASLIGFLMQLSLLYHYNFLISISVLVVLIGIIAQARIALGDHQLSETVWGVFLGIIPQIVVLFIFS